MDTPATIAIVVVTILTSLIGFNRPALAERFKFSTWHVLARKEYERVFTSGFLHGDGWHLGLNMFSFFFFARAIEVRYGAASMLLIYFSAIIGGSLLSLLIHRHHDYHAWGASGGVCGILFAHIFMNPGGSIIMFPLPIPIPTWLYAIVFLVGSYRLMRGQSDGIGHDAHLGGAIIGLLVATALYPHIARSSPLLFAAVLIITTLLFLHLNYNPLHLPSRPFLRKAPEEDPHPRYSTDHLRPNREADRILEKISVHGLQSLTEEERQFMEQHAEKLRRREQ